MSSYPSRQVIFLSIWSLLLIGSFAWWLLKPIEEVHIAALPVDKAHPEGCLVCHDSLTGFSPHHDPVVIGCASCHLGVASATDKTEAHKGMLRVPGNLVKAPQTCGTTDCHPLITAWNLGSLMASGRGLVAVDRFVIGEAPTPDGPGHLSHLGHSPADQHLKQLCSTCHLGFPKDEPEPVNELSRGGGCLACHLHYSAEAKADWEKYKTDKTIPQTHASLTVRVTNDHCFGCHSRSSRISLSYEGWHESSLPLKEKSDNNSTRMLMDGRTLVRQSEDVHHTAGMECVDCHTWREAMGDGLIHRHAEEAVEISCEDCHFTGEPRTISSNALHDIEQKLLQLHNWTDDNPHFLAIAKTGHAILNSTFNVSSEPVLLGKNYGTAWPLKEPAQICERSIEGHSRVSCQSCHSAWAPQCIECHTQLEPGEDSGLTMETAESGLWVEYAGKFLAEPPALGVRENSNRIEPFVPGMILTLNTELQEGHQIASEHDRFLRLYAPIAPHTTTSKGRDCASCHTNPVALGYGRGKLEFHSTQEGKGRWSFEPEYEPHPADGLPLDAWIEFLRPGSGTTSTRTDARPLSVAEQQRILTVGACLQCHPFNSSSVTQIYSQFNQAIANRQASCRLPEWSEIRN